MEVSINKDIRLSEHLASPSAAALSQTSELDGIRLSPHFTLGEMTKTKYQTEDGNIPTRVAIENLKNLCEGWLEDLRYSYNTLYCLEPGDDYGASEKVEGIVINSGYRSAEVNRRCGGSPTSNHLSGCAADIRCLGPEQLLRYGAILLDIADGKRQDFDELLLEKRGSAYWIHLAVRPDGNRRRIAMDMR